MGLAASQGRLLFLTSHKSDLEYSMQDICQKRMNLAMQSSQLSKDLSSIYKDAATAGTDVGNYSSTNSELVTRGNTNTGSIEAKMSDIQSQDKLLEMEQKQIETKHKAAETELESVKKVIDKNIETSYKYFA